LTLLAAPLAAQAPSVSVAATMDTLENGLTVIVHEDQSVPIVAVNMWYHVGSGDEKAGRTGFAHLFEHLMFMASEHAEYPAFDRLLEAAGADNNGSTTEDRTNYYEWGPASALPLMLWLEADRMGWFVPTMSTEKVDLQRDVVKNERRQSYENQPYGLASETILRALYAAAHPYSWPVIGSMTDLSAASLEDTKDFFRSYYTPNNASLVVAGAVKAPEVFRLARQYFGEIPRGPATPRSTAQPFALSRDTALVLEDQVQLPRLYYVWPAVPHLSPDDAALELLAYVLSGEKNSRLDQTLVHDERVASSVTAFHDGKRLAGDFWIIATARPEKSLPELQAPLTGSWPGWPVRARPPGKWSRPRMPPRPAFSGGWSGSTRRPMRSTATLSTPASRTGFRSIWRGTARSPREISSGWPGSICSRRAWC